MQKISKTAARAVLAELQEIGDDAARTGAGLTDGVFARVVIARLTGSLEGRLPRAEWNKVDIFRRKRS